MQSEAFPGKRGALDPGCCRTLLGPDFSPLIQAKNPGVLFLQELASLPDFSRH